MAERQQYNASGARSDAMPGTGGRPAEGEGALVGLQVDARDEDDVAPALAGSDLTLEQGAVDDLEQDQSGAVAETIWRREVAEQHERHVLFELERVRREVGQRDGVEELYIAM